MKISLSPEVERLIAEKVEGGGYQSADEVVREALQLLQEREKQARRSPSDHTGNCCAVFDSIAHQIPDTEWEKVPADLAKNLDHYLYGSQKTS